jgi:peptidoglycan/xylan/chitin deacetylase (PgdA/CDA1 family)
MTPANSVRDILRDDSLAALKLRRWRKKLTVLLRPNALGMTYRRFASTGRRRLSRGSTPPGPRHGVILMYHRIAEPPSDPQLLCVSPRHFAEQLEVVQQSFRIITLHELVRRSYAGEPLAGTAAITFDDGYADNLHHARPALQRAGAPATVFVTSSYMGNSVEFWWDELERVLLQAGTVPPLLELRIGDRRYSWNLGEDAHYDVTALERNRGWNVEQGTLPTRRHELYRCLHMLLSMLPSAQREDALSQLRTWAQLGRDGRASHRALTEDETRALAQDGLVEIGAHTATHPVLSMLPLAEQKAEMRTGKERLEQVIGRPVTSFAYPYGALSDYKAETVKAAQELGFDCACSTFANVITGGRDRYQLPRFAVRDWDGDELQRHLQAWTHP